MRSLIAWFTRNPVAANLLMVFIIASGLVTIATRLPVEVFPEFELEFVTVQIAWPGAGPEAMERAVAIPVEDAIHDLGGVRSLETRIREGTMTVIAELARDVDPSVARDEMERRVEAITDLPQDAERAIVTIPDFDREVLTAVVSGHVSERVLRRVADRVRDEIALLPEVSTARLSGARERELVVEVSSAALERHDLTLSEVATALDASALDIATGNLRTAGGDVRLRTRVPVAELDALAAIVIRSGTDGSHLQIGDVATLVDGFEETSLSQRFEGVPAIEIEVFRSASESALVTSAAVREWIESARGALPPGVELGYWRDASRVVEARLDTLLSSALQGGVLIVLLLGLFLKFRVALWVFVGVPVSMLGGIALMPFFGVTLNLLSLFAFILVLGIVVDDAIVTGENIHRRMEAGGDPVAAAIDGTEEIAVPVTFGVLTTVAAFLPLLMIEGARGALFAQIPMIVIPVLLFSIIESKLVLPAHLAHARRRPPRAPGVLARLQRRVADGFEHAVAHRWQPRLDALLRRPGLVLAVFVAVTIVVFALAIGGQLRFVFFPTVQSEVARATLRMPDGTPESVTALHIERIGAAAEALRAAHVDPDTGESVIERVMTRVGGAGGSERGAHLGRVTFEIVPPEERRLEITSRELVREWQSAVGEIPGAEALSYRAEIGRGGSPIEVQLRGSDVARLESLANDLRARLETYPEVLETTDSFEGGREEIRLELTPFGERIGLTTESLARQTRDAFFGIEVETVQRAGETIDIVLRYPLAERRTVDDLESLAIRTPGGERVPLGNVARFLRAEGPPSIERVDRQRSANVQAEVDKRGGDIEGLKADLRALAGELEARYPGLAVTLEGEAREQRESFRSLGWGLAFVLLVVYTLLAIPFRSYIQPLLVMAVIPFGVVGGMLGHLIMGMPLSIMSYAGMLALCGVVVNDSLVLVDYVNRRRREGMDLREAVRTAGVARVRAVLLTSLTTFFGLLPLIFEDSTQAQFLIPMAVSLGFGILFATAITLILVPVNYLLLERVRVGVGRVWGGDETASPSHG